MKAMILMILAIVLPLSSVGSYQEPIARHPIVPEKFTYTSFIDSKQFYTEFTEKDVPDTPSWNPQRGNPPIRLSKAIEKSKKILSKFVPNSIVWEIESIRYTKVGKDKWVYEIDYYLDRLQATDGLSASFTVILKMDGTFFEPKITVKR